MKDSWRIVADDAPSEGRVYQTLNEGKVKNIPFCVDFCDVDDDSSDHKTRTGTYSSSNAAWVPSGFQFPFSVLRHHRLILDTIGKELEEFSSSLELVRAIRDALVAHKEAYLRCGVLHRDISSGNILITDGHTSGGLLIDWDMCKLKDGGERQIGEHRTYREGTWEFMAADLTMGSALTQTSIHDLESAFYVLSFLVLHCHTAWEPGQKAT
ncbi:hypothetical protein BC826DRAFT_1048476, partial [Russula brevipes]